MRRRGRGNQAVAHHVFEDFGVGPPPQQLMFVYNDFPDQVGVVDQQQQCRFYRHGYQVAVGGGFLHESDGVAKVAEGLANDAPFGWARRQGFAAHRRLRGIFDGCSHGGVRRGGVVVDGCIIRDGKGRQPHPRRRRMATGLPRRCAPRNDRCGWALRQAQHERVVNFTILKRPWGASGWC